MTETSSRPDNTTESRGETEEHQATISKRELKRQLKRQKVLDERPAKRAAERARKKARKLEKQPETIQEQADDEDPSVQKILSSTDSRPTIFPSSVVFDCRFDDKMSEKEIVSLDRQLAHSYAINRRATIQFEKLICTSFNGKLRKRFESNGNQHLRWKSVKFMSESVEDLVPEESQSSKEKEKGEGAGEGEGEENNKDPKMISSRVECLNDNPSPSSPSSLLKISNNLQKVENNDNIQIDHRLIDRKTDLSIGSEEQAGENPGHENCNEAPPRTDQPISDTIASFQESNQPDVHLQDKQFCASTPTAPAGPSDQHLIDNLNSMEFKNFNKSDFIYLTADSKNVVTSIDPSKVYIIGSLVDHNRYKNLCLDLSDQLGINHAQLPINEYFSQLKTRKVLTVNQVFEILVRFLELKDWKIAFEKVIPSRKL